MGQNYTTHHPQHMTWPIKSHASLLPHLCLVIICKCHCFKFQFFIFYLSSFCCCCCVCNAIAYSLDGFCVISIVHVDRAFVHAFECTFHNKLPALASASITNSWHLHGVARIGFLRDLWFSPASKNHAGRCTGDVKLPLGVHKCVNPPRSCSFVLTKDDKISEKGHSIGNLCSHYFFC